MYMYEILGALRGLSYLLDSSPGSSLFYRSCSLFLFKGSSSLTFSVPTEQELVGELSASTNGLSIECCPPTKARQSCSASVRPRNAALLVIQCFIGGFARRLKFSSSSLMWWWLSTSINSDDCSKLLLQPLIFGTDGTQVAEQGLFSSLHSLLQDHSINWLSRLFFRFPF